MSSLQQLRAAVIDGRTRGIRYRQKQLRSLHEALRSKATEITVAITKDAEATRIEVESEYFLAMSTIKDLCESIDLHHELKEEYSVKMGVDNVKHRVGVGLVVMKPTTHTRFYSILCPLAAAIAAGNCILLELGDTLLNVDKILKEILPKALDQDTFMISNTPTSESELESVFLVDQQSTQTSPSTTNQLLSKVNSRAVAIVDRTANIDEAAKVIVAARFGFSGTSSYAPDLVIVNEFVKQKFFEACTKYASQAFAADTKPSRSTNNAVAATRKLVKEAESKRQISAFGSANFQLVDILDRDAGIARSKIVGKCLPVVACRSLMDAVYSQSTESTLLAGYFFADQAACKFLAQHLMPHMSFINQIPTNLLLGPAAPVDREPSYPQRYTPAMLSVARPQFVQAVTGDFAQVESSMVSLEKLRTAAVKPLKKLDQGPGHAIGFFEQGILTGLIMTASVVLPIVGYGSWVLGRKCWQMAVKAM